MRVEDHVSPRLIYLATQLNNTLPLFKAWGVTVQDKARANARRKGGRRLWKMIASMTRVTKLTPFETHVECLSYIGAHKEYGGIIRVKEKSALTIPIIKEAQAPNLYASSPDAYLEPHFLCKIASYRISIIFF